MNLDSIVNLHQPFDPFANLESEERTVDEKIHIRLQKRNGKKYWTIIENLTEFIDDIKDIKKFMKYIKKKYGCNATFIKDPKIVQFQGNQVRFAIPVLKKMFEITKDSIITHGE